MAAVGEAGADRFRPHFPAIEWDDMVDAFKSEAAVVNSVTFHTRAPARGMRIARCERDDLHGPDGKSRGAASGAAPDGPEGISPNPASIAAPAGCRTFGVDATRPSPPRG